MLLPLNCISLFPKCNRFVIGCNFETTQRVDGGGPFIGKISAMEFHSTKLFVLAENQRIVRHILKFPHNFSIILSKSHSSRASIRFFNVAE